MSLAKWPMRKRDAARAPLPKGVQALARPCGKLRPMKRPVKSFAHRWPGRLALSCLLLPWAAQAFSPPERLECHGRTYDVLGDPLAQHYAGRERPRFMPA